MGETKRDKEVSRENIEANMSLLLQPMYNLCITPQLPSDKSSQKHRVV